MENKKRALLAVFINICKNGFKHFKLTSVLKLIIQQALRTCTMLLKVLKPEGSQHFLDKNLNKL